MALYILHGNDGLPDRQGYSTWKTTSARIFPWVGIQMSVDNIVQSLFESFVSIDILRNHLFSPRRVAHRRVLMESLEKKYVSLEVETGKET